MTSVASSLSFNAFATPDAGNDYLATAEHYQYLARAIIGALHRGLVLVTGDPPANLAMLVEAFKAATPREVIAIPCGPEFTREQLSGHGSPCPGAPILGGAKAEEPSAPALASPISIFADADRLSDDQIKDILETAQAAPPDHHVLDTGVLLAHSAFLARFENPELHGLEEGIAAHLRVQQLERDEVEAFIRHQLPPGEGENLFTAQRLALIAITSGGDPAVVNRLARRMLAIEPDDSAGGLPAKLSQAWNRCIRKSGKEFIAESGATPHRSVVSLRLPAGIIIGLAVLIAAVFASQDFRAVVGLVRDHVFPEKELPAAPSNVATVPPPAAAAGSSSATVVAPLPRAAPPSQPTLEPAANGAEHPSAGPFPQPAPVPAPPPAATGAEHPSAAPAPPPAPESAPRPAPAGPRLSAAEIAALVARGDAFLSAGDIISARLFFERAADAGDSRAAMRMAVTFDTAFLEKAGLHGLRGDPEKAAFWYRRASDLRDGKGDPQPR